MKRLEGLLVFITVMAFFSFLLIPLSGAGGLPGSRIKTGFRIDNEKISNRAPVMQSGVSSQMEGLGSSSSPYEYAVTVIDPILGRERSRCYGINNMGQVVGKAYDYDTETEEEYNRQAFIWDSTNGYKILPPLVENAESGVWGINYNGQVSGYSFNADVPDVHKHGIRWDNTAGPVGDIVIVDIGTLINTNVTPPLSGDESTCYDLNNMGKVVGYSDIWNDAGDFQAFHAVKYDDSTGIQDLGTLTTHAPQWQNGYSIAYEINSSDESVGIADDSSWNLLPFIHDDTNGMQALNIDPAYTGCEWYASVINDSGFIGGFVISAASTHQRFPYYWQNSSADPIPITMPAGFPYGEIYGVNESGQMVGTMWDSDQEDAVEHGFVFDIQNGVRDLNDLIDPASGCVVTYVRDINDSGQISGACEVGGNKRGVLLNGTIQIKDELACDFGTTYGLYDYNEAAGWTQLNTADPGLIVSVDIDEDGQDELAVGFVGYGLYTYDDSNGWTQINTVIPEGMVAFGGTKLACDFGSAYGLYTYDQANGWTQLNTADPGEMVSVDIDNDGQDELAVNFNGYGLYTYGEANGWTQINTVVPEGMIPADIFN